MYTADRDNIQNAEDRAASWATLGFALHAAKHNTEALRWEQNAVKEYGVLMNEDAYSPDVADSYAEALLELARIRQDLRLPGACEDVLRARETARNLVSRAPKDATLQKRLKQAQEFPGCAR